MPLQDYLKIFIEFVTFITYLFNNVLSRTYLRYSLNMGLGCFILNILSPDLGTKVQSYYAKDGCSCSTWMVGFAQGLLAIIVVGWVWSIWHGYEVMLVSDKAALAGGQQVIVVNGGM